MSLKRVTMQEIADACGLSRNTVSKVFNERGNVPEATKKTVLKKAQELGYYHPAAQVPLPAEPLKGTIALLTRQQKLLNQGFAALFITSFTNEICRLGYTIKFFEISPAEIAHRNLPPHLEDEEVEGILGIEFFDQDYASLICSLKKPTVFVDGYAHASTTLMECDFISMENISSERALVNRMLKAGARRIGFMGDITHCNSFYERWMGYGLALQEAGLPMERSLCILEKDSPLYADIDWILEKLEALPQMPDAFACANDFLAIHLMAALKKKGLSIPEDVMVAGFDGSLEASVMDPSLATAEIPGAQIGRLAASLLSERILAPNAAFRWIYVKTTPIWGGSIR